MRYRFAAGEDFGDVASGLVLRSAPGHPAFPARLALELFDRARHALGNPPAVTLWDPVCGAGQSLTTLGLLRRSCLRAVLGSDAHAEPLQLASRNLALLTTDGIAARQRELTELAEAHGKDSHAQAAAAAARLAERLSAGGGDLAHTLHQANALDPGATGPLAVQHSPEIVFADVPHGQQTGWTPHGEYTGEALLIEALNPVLPAGSVIIVASRARRVPLPADTAVIERLKVGHRVAVLLRPRSR